MTERARRNIHRNDAADQYRKALRGYYRDIERVAHGRGRERAKLEFFIGNLEKILTLPRGKREEAFVSLSLATMGDQQPIAETLHTGDTAAKAA